MNTPTIALTALTGAAAGPWLRGIIFSYSVAAGRPRRTRCPRCRHPTGTGWNRRLPSSGRCPGCSRRLGAPKLAVELSTALVLAVVAWRSPSVAALISLSALALAGVVLSFVDFGVRRLPDPIVAMAAAGIAAAILANAFAQQQWQRIAVAAFSAAVCGGFYLLLAIVLPIGLGDVKWAAVLALVCGWFGFRVAFTGLTAGAFIAVIIAGLLLLFRRANRHTVLPAGPSLSAGALVALALHDV